MSATRSTSIIPPAYLPYLANAAATIGVIPTLLGVVGLVQPQIPLDQIGYPRSKSDQHLLIGLTRLTAARNLAIGVSTLAVWYATRTGQASYRTLGSVFATFSFFLAVDGWIVKDVVGQGEWGHWGFVPIAAGVGLGLMGVY